jgi:uncharacterized integral membrane protein
MPSLVEPGRPTGQDTSTPDPDLAVPVAPQPQPHTEITPTPPVRIARTKLSGAWIAVIVAAVGLVFLLIFILQNPTRTGVHFLGANGTLPMGVAMLLSAVTGALVLALLGSARMLQLRRAARRRDH